MARPPSTWLQSTVYAAVALALSAWLIFGFSPQRGVPDRSSLQSATGDVAWLESSKYGLSFGLQGHDLRFVYSANSGDVTRVQRHLRSAAPVTVRYWATSEGDGSVSVWGVTAPNVSVRSFDEITEYRRRDSYLAFPLGLFFGVAALYFIDRAWRLYEGKPAD